MNKKATHLIPSIILYILAIALTAFAIWAYSQCSDIITQARASGQLPPTGVEYDIASFYMVNCGLYFALAVLMAAAGLILQRKQPAPIVVASTAVAPYSDAGDEEDYADDEEEPGDGGNGEEGTNDDSNGGEETNVEENDEWELSDKGNGEEEPGDEENGEEKSDELRS